MYTIDNFGTEMNQYDLIRSNQDVHALISNRYKKINDSNHIKTRNVPMRKEKTQDERIRTFGLSSSKLNKVCFY